MVLKEKHTRKRVFSIIFSVFIFNGIQAQIVTPEVTVEATPNGETIIKAAGQDQLQVSSTGVTISDLEVDNLKSNTITNDEGTGAPSFPFGIAEPEVVLSNVNPLGSAVIKTFTPNDQGFWMASTRQVVNPLNNNTSGASFYVDSDGTAIQISSSSTTLVSLHIPASNTDPDFGKLRIYHQLQGQQTFKTVLLKISSVSVP